MDETKSSSKRVHTTAEYRARCAEASDTLGAQVASFHEKVGAPSPCLISDTGFANTESDDEIVDAIENAVADMLEAVSDFTSMMLQDRYKGDTRLLRAKLLVEELSETLDAMARRDEVELLDGLCDLAYVVQGTAITYDIPLFDGLREVHESNMTKHTAQMACANHTGDKGKGKDYVPPNIEQVIKEYRNA